MAYEPAPFIESFNNVSTTKVSNSSDLNNLYTYVKNNNNSLLQKN